MPSTPALPPDVAGGVAPQPQTPNMFQMAGMAGPGGGAQPGQTAGQSQISESAVRMGAEIDQALKLLAQAIPALAPWVEKTILELRFQIGSALQAGAQPTSPIPQDAQRFPDGGARL
jgi:hypothetical protein